MTDMWDIMTNPGAHGYEECGHCNGYGSSLRDPDGVDVCTKCGGKGYLTKAPSEQVDRPLPPPKASDPDPCNGLG